MGWSSGTFRVNAGFASGRNIWGQAEALDRDVRSDDHDAVDNEMADGINNCLTKDGQNEPTGNLPMGGQKHTGVAAAEADDDYAAWGQAKGYADGAIADAIAPTIGTLVDQENIVWDVEANPSAKVTLEASRTLANPINPVEGGVYSITVIQDATGGRTLAYGSAYDFGSAGEPELTSDGGAVDILAFQYSVGKMRL